MMRILSFAFLVLLISGCGNQKTENKLSNDEVQINQEEVKTTDNTPVVVSEKKVIIYLPDSVEEIKLNEEIDPETIASIEYDKTEVVSFFIENEIDYSIENKRFYYFKTQEQVIDTLDKKDFQNWGVIFFRPDKLPKVVFLNEVTEEYSKYFD